ncbi:hypothetical protein OS493_022001 [Desmophyllum pertusum]|uniref:Uncharacterized protein n=1 Tax=Desmophyllum pertusum TaxID=174260 RepID=A0A9W9Z2A8_9CNID|nr:hypothetical protein OS493_022001 [Desmophyllum pertusum]
MKQTAPIPRPTAMSNTDVSIQKGSEDEGEDLMDTDDEKEEIESETEEDRTSGIEEAGLFENIDAETETTRVRRVQQNSELKHANEASKRKRSIVILEEDEIEEFQKNQVAKNTVKGTECAVRRLEAWYNERYGKKLVLTNINKANAAELIEAFFSGNTRYEKREPGEEYEPSTLTTYEMV